MAHDERDKVLNKIGHNMEYEIFVRPCKHCINQIGGDYAVLAVSQSLADSYAQDCIDDCPNGKCRVKVVKYKG